MMEIVVGARASPLSRVQVAELLRELQLTHPDTYFRPIYVNTTGDNDRKTSLRDLDKTDFFTRELDEMVLNQECRIAIHSAKDLPDPLPQGLKLIALTKGVDPSDSLVLREKERLDSITTVATSSARREESVRALRCDLKFVDIRGTILERLDQLYTNIVDGVVIAEAALIRLGLIHLNRLSLPGETAPLQGRLAVLAREEDMEMHSLFI